MKKYYYLIPIIGIFQVLYFAFVEDENLLPDGSLLCFLSAVMQGMVTTFFIRLCFA